MLKKAEYTPSPSNKKDQAPSETLGLFLIPGAFSGSLCGALCGSLLLPLALGLSAEGLISYSLIFLLLGEGVYLIKEPSLLWGAEESILYHGGP